MSDIFVAEKLKSVKSYLGFQEDQDVSAQKLYDYLIFNSKRRTYTPRLHQKHHINPRCFGGSDEDENISYLTFEEHIFAHALLAEMNSGGRREAMLHALCVLTFTYSLSSQTDYELALDTKSKLLIGNDYAKNFPRTPEYLEKLRLSKLGNKNALGWVQTAEHKDKNKKAQFIRFSQQPDEYEKLIKRMTGNTYGRANRGKKHTKDFCEAISHRMKGKKHAKGNKSKSKPVICLEDSIVYPSAKSAAQAYNVNASKVTAVCKGGRKRTCGLTFAYANEQPT